MHQCRGQLSRSLLSYPPTNYELEKNIHSIAGGKRGRFCRCSVCAVCCVCSVLRRLAVCAVLRDGDGGDGEHSDTTALCDRNVSFQPARNIPSLCWGLPPVPPVSAKQGDRDCYFLFRQNVARAAAAAGGSSSSRRKQQQQEAAAARSSSSRR